MVNVKWSAQGMNADRRVAFSEGIKVGMSCDHIAGARHRFAMFDTLNMVNDLRSGDDLSGVCIPLGGVRVGSFGIVLMGFAATDMWAVLRNVILEDEHCVMCCGRLLRTCEGLVQKVLLRCGPTIGPRDAEMSGFEARRITDEYWTD